jgi:hypothetical protein
MTEFSPREQLLIEALKRLKGGDIDAHVRGELKIRIMREIASREAAPGTAFYPRFAFASLIAAFAVFLAGAASRVSKNSLPNDALYPVKVAAEEVRMIFARDPAQKAMLQAEFARERIHEARTIANARADPALVAATLGRYEESVKKVRDTVASIEKRPAGKTAESVNAIAKNLSDTAVALLEEAQKQLAESPATSSPEVSQKFVEAAQTSVAVLSEVVERLEGGEVDSAPVLP